MSPLDMSKASANFAEKRFSNVAFRSQPGQVFSLPKILSARERPRAAQEQPRTTQEQPSAAQERPSVAQERPRVTRERQKAARERPKNGQEQSKSRTSGPRAAKISLCFMSFSACCWFSSECFSSIILKFLAKSFLIPTQHVMRKRVQSKSATNTLVARIYSESGNYSM